ncbi:Conserved oligomeric Golgi complex subunit 2, variant 2 [Schistosoma haematobium]|nr:Conserved oligomeric Golgi complex subunit 2, variant 2 [Schistosoma haematobium]KAH9584724.1 Conserved oligomeric Golgi complex subunit 2, variant 2 [Schistosoma haematobium]
MKLDGLGLRLSQSVPNAQPFLSTLIKKCITTVTHDYTAQLSEVSTSVRKMEDSIRRLREVRRSSSQIFNQPQSVNGSSGFHSDDKIRHQLYLDAKAYIDEVSNVTLL